MKQYKYVIFDFDGTLIDSRVGVRNAVAETLHKQNLILDKAISLDVFVGPPMQDSIEKYFKLGRDKSINIANDFRAIYKEKHLFECDLYDKVTDVLEYLVNYGYKIAIATNKSHENANLIFHKLKLDKYVDIIIGSDLECKKTKCDIINECLVAMQCDDKSTVIIVGDSNYDFDAATKLGIDFIGVSYGYGFSKERRYNFPIINNIIDLQNLISK